MQKDKLKKEFKIDLVKIKQRKRKIKKTKMKKKYL